MSTAASAEPLCEARVVGQVIATSIAINGIRLDDPTHTAVVARIGQELSRVQRVLAPEIAALGASAGQGPALPAELAARHRFLDRAVVCSVMCCCHATPGQGAVGQNLMQGCAHGVLTAADAALGWKSRYKSEVSWNMHRRDGSGPPTPLMHRDSNGQDTTEPSHNWMMRLAEVVGYKPAQGDVRRPDLVIVSDPARPPSRETIDQVVEFKFGEDRRDRKQDLAYQGIAGRSEKFAVYRVGAAPRKDEQGCDCAEPMKPPLPAPVPVSRSEEEPAPRSEGDVQRVGAAVGWAAVAAVAAVATVLAVLSPFEGPAGEMAAGAATAGAAARAAAAWRALGAAF